MIEFWAPIIFALFVLVAVAIVFRPGAIDKLQVSPIEAGIILFGSVLIVLLMWNVGISQKVTDTENLSGRIAEKGSSDVSCRHCRSVCDGYDSKGNCTSHHEECDHSFDRVWWAKTDYAKYFPTEGTITFPTTDRQGLNQPERWTQVVVGEPATTLHKYTNWLRGAGKESILFPSSYLTDTLIKEGMFPPRFQNYHYDYYHQPRAIYIGNNSRAGWQSAGPNFSLITPWTQALMESNAIIGPEKQGNLQIFLVGYPDPEYANAYMDWAKGGAKNDIDVFVGVDGNYKPTWVQVKFGLPGFDQTEIDGNNSSNALLAVKIRDEIMKLKEIQDTSVVDISTRLVMEGFDRVPNKQFEYLKNQLRPDDGMMTGIWVVSFVYLGLSIAVALGMTELDI